MDWQAALRARLTDTAAITALVSTRVYWVDRPQASALPAITLQTISDIRPQHMKGNQASRESIVQVDVWATSYASAREISEEVIAALVPENTSNGIIFGRAFVDSLTDLGERIETQFVHRTRIDFSIHHQAA